MNTTYCRYCGDVLDAAHPAQCQERRRISTKYPLSKECPDCRCCPECKRMVHADKTTQHHGSCSHFGSRDPS